MGTTTSIHTLDESDPILSKSVLYSLIKTAVSDEKCNDCQSTVEIIMDRYNATIGTHLSFIDTLHRIVNSNEDATFIDIMRNIVVQEKYDYCFPVRDDNGNWYITNLQKECICGVSLSDYIDCIYDLINIICFMQYDFADKFVELIIEKIILTEYVAKECKIVYSDYKFDLFENEPAQSSYLSAVRKKVKKKHDENIIIAKRQATISLECIGKLFGHYNVGHSMSKILANLSNTEVMKYVDDNVLIWLLNTSMQPEEIDVSKNPNITDRSMKEFTGLVKLIATNNPNITNQSIYANPTIRILIARGESGISDTGVATLHNLEELDCRCNEKITGNSFCNKVKLIKLYFCNSHDNVVTDESIEFLSNLKELMLYDHNDCFHCDICDGIEYSPFFLRGRTKLCKHGQSNICKEHTRRTYDGNNGLTDDGLLGKNLIKLSIPFCEAVTDEGIKHLQLTHLNARGCPHITDVGINGMPIETLGAGDTCGITDKGIITLKNLTSINIVNNLNIDESFLKHFNHTIYVVSLKNKQRFDCSDENFRMWFDHWNTSFHFTGIDSDERYALIHKMAVHSCHTNPVDYMSCDGRFVHCSNSLPVPNILHP